MTQVVKTVIGEDLVVQGFRGGPEDTDKPYVFVGTFDPDYGMLELFSFGPREAHEFSEIIRSQAEFALAGENMEE